MKKPALIFITAGALLGGIGAGHAQQREGLHAASPDPSRMHSGVFHGDHHHRVVAIVVAVPIFVDQSAAQRMADDRRDAALVERAALMAYAPAEQRGANDYGPAYVSDYGFVSHPFMHHHPMQRRQPKLHHMGHFAPHPPFIVPRSLGNDAHLASFAHGLCIVHPT
jgi:hypothetical protein